MPQNPKPHDGASLVEFLTTDLRPCEHDSCAHGLCGIVFVRGVFFFYRCSAWSHLRFGHENRFCSVLSVQVPTPPVPLFPASVTPPLQYTLVCTLRAYITLYFRQYWAFEWA